LFIATALLTLGLSRSASADLFAYAATANGDFGKLDLDTGAYTSIGPSGVTSIVGLGSIGGTLYGVDNSPDGAGFYSISTATGAATLLATLVDGSTGAPITAYGGTTAGSSFYGVTQEALANLFTTGPTGSPAFLINSLGFSADGLVALDASGMNLYVSEFTGDPFNGDELHRINIDGTIHDVGPLGQQAITGLIDGTTLYAIDGNTIFTYTVGLSSVVGIGSTTITGLEGDQVFAVAAAPATVVPEPGSLAIVGLAMLAAGVVHARRRRQTA